MKKNIIFLLVGTMFGFIFARSEIISFFRIQEMFLFQSIHMYGFMGSAVVVIVSGLFLFKQLKLRNLHGDEIKMIPIELKPGSLIGGIIFGLGWGLIGACPGPLFTLLGGGYFAVLVAIAGALSGTYLFGILEKHLP